ncbi:MULTISPECIES: hypothetical protein [Actinomadura]|uniref:Resolvase/invertase-type recombinase catalytic domain-containing protein n=1 Tax=Actinomadura yumaensis TaxID=111807 RepID=A0ABW2CHV1_9ACTN|nr:hypothetical protein [Actinomadura sp. J1-007]
MFIVLAGMSGMEREYIRDRTLEGHESARTRGKTIGGASGTDDAMLSHALHLRDQNMSLRDIAACLVITKGKKKGQHSSPAIVLRMLREHGQQAANAGALSSRSTDQAQLTRVYLVTASLTTGLLRGPTTAGVSPPSKTAPEETTSICFGCAVRWVRGAAEGGEFAFQ